MRRNGEVRSSTTLARQLHESQIKNCHIHIIEIKCSAGCEDTRPGAQLEASQQQHSELCKQLQGAEITLYTILLGLTRKGLRPFKGSVLTAYAVFSFLYMSSEEIAIEESIAIPSGAPLHAFAWLPSTDFIPLLASFHNVTDLEVNAFLNQGLYTFSKICQNLFQTLILDENVSPAADQPESRAVGQPPCNPYR
eukprot:1162023-Pelagomonas_calceolata.AAC.5